MLNERLDLPFDLYTRNQIISDLINFLRENKNSIKILDIGGRSGHIKEFLQQEDELYILDIRKSEQNEDNYFIGNILNAPFRDKIFDIVVSSDLYEHISGENRLNSLSEMIRIGKNFVILAAPFYSQENTETEIKANEFFNKLIGNDHPWLSEHIQNGLPSKKELEDFLKNKRFDYFTIETNNISIWLLMQLFIFYSYKYSISDKNVRKVYRFYNENFLELGDTLSPTYRTIYLIGKKGSLPKVNFKFNSVLDRLKYHTLETLIFESIGQFTSDRDTHTKNLEATIEQLNTVIQSKDSQIRNLEIIVQESDKQKTELNTVIQSKDSQIRNLEITLQSIHQSVTWQIVMKYHRVIEKLLPQGTMRRYYYDLGLIGIRIIANQGWKSFWWKVQKRFRQQNRYHFQLKRNTLTIEYIRNCKEELNNLSYKPKISIVTPVYNVKEKWLKVCIESVLNQIYENWELCIVDDASTKSHIKLILKEYEQKDNRIKVKYLTKNSGISGASNQALSLATGEFVGFLDNDDELYPDALFEIVKLLNKSPDIDIIYTDEDKIELNGKRVDPFFKPDWSPDLLLNCHYMAHFIVFRRKLLESLNGFQSRFDGAQDYDLILRAVEKTEKIGHISKVLYGWRKIPGSSATGITAKSYAYVSAANALKDALVRRNKKGDIIFLPDLGYFRIKYLLNGNPLVSIIILTHDRPDLLDQCIRSIETKSTYKNYEIIIVDRKSEKEGTLEYLKKLKHKVVRYDKELNISDALNYGASFAKGEHLLFLNDDIEVISPDWIECMLEHSQRKEVGMVGALLLYPNSKLHKTPDTIQHAGVVLGIGGTAGHAFRHIHATHTGYFGLNKVIRNYNAITGACAMMKKEIFLQVGGWDKNLAVSYGDIDLCLRVRQKGYLIIYTPYAKLYHYEGSTRGSLDPTIDEIFFMKRWQNLLAKRDPYYSIHLTLIREDFTLASFSHEITPLSLLVEIYNHRPDLQNAFPEVSKGNYQGLIDWAVNYGVKNDPHSSILRKWSSWYSSLYKLSTKNLIVYKALSL